MRSRSGLAFLVHASGIARVGAGCMLSFLPGILSCAVSLISSLGHAIHVMKDRPAILGPAIEPKGLPPRRVDDHEVLEHQGELLRQLAEAAQ